jgi:hypothetical protein
MDFNDYALEVYVRDRLAAARAAAVRRALLPARRGRLRVEVGAALIALGRWLATPEPAADRTRA